ncbi:hypothetical protein [Klebsiella pneumoniae]
MEKFELVAEMTKAVTAKKYALECKAEYHRYRENCRNTRRGSGVHGLWVKLAWLNRRCTRAWASQAV